MRNKFENLIKGDRILILGFGKEGHSTLRFLQKYFSDKRISVADQNLHIEYALKSLSLDSYQVGDRYLENINQFDLVIKSPGISLKGLKEVLDLEKVSSQTELFLRLYRKQTIGITGTKGKSTTSSLIHHIIKGSGRNVFLVGNIGVPPLDLVDEIDSETQIVFEMSSHQLDGIHISPGIAIVLNLFEEHLDHYGSMELYRRAKYKIFESQGKDDWLICNGDDRLLSEAILESGAVSNNMIFSSKKLDSNGAYINGDGEVFFKFESEQQKYNFSNRNSIPGKHNLYNIMASLCACKIIGIDDKNIKAGVNSFDGLEHRMEYVGKFKGIHFYNDSIATIPEATIEALNTLGKIDTLILGGKDRGINYKELIDFLDKRKVNKLILTGEVGVKLEPAFLTKGWKKNDLIMISSFNGLGNIIKSNTPQNGICLLSPAASSYDMFENFEHRGQAYKKIAETL